LWWKWQIGIGKLFAGAFTVISSSWLRGSLDFWVVIVENYNYGESCHGK
jgi:hypothetical protein